MDPSPDEVFSIKSYETINDYPESEGLFKDTFDQSAIGMYQLTLDGKILRANKQFSELIGYSLKELQDKTYVDITCPEDHNKESLILQQIKNINSGNCTVEKRYVKKDGSFFWAKLKLSLIATNTPGGKVTYFNCLVEDITKQKIKDEQTRFNEARLQSLVNVLQYRSDSVQEMLDHALNEAIELTESDFGYIYHYYEEKKEFILNTWSPQVMKECSFIDFPETYQLDNIGIWGEPIRQRKHIIINDFQAPNQLKKGYPNGHIEIDKFMTIPIFEKDTIVGVVGVGNKISDYTQTDVLQLTLLMDSVWKVLGQKKAEQELRKREKLLSKIFETLPIGLWLTDEKGNILSGNPAGKRIWGAEPHVGIEEYGMFKARFFPSMKELKAEDWALSHTIVDGATIEKELLEIDAFDGVSRIIQNYSAPVIDDDGEMLGAIVVNNDITDLKHTEMNLMEAKLAAEAASRTKSEFLATMSHELRTPLNAIIGYSNMLIDGDFGELNGKQERFAGHIATSGKHLLELINDILDISKTEAGKMELYYENFIVNEIMQNVMAIITPLAKKKSIALKLEIKPDTLTLNADRMKFKHILYNLGSNAVKFTPEGGNIRISAIQKEDIVEVSVADDGIGIAKEKQHKLFTPFYQVDSSDSRRYAGTGLGLALVKNFVELHAGHITFESEFGKGSTFTFSIPSKKQ
ncbi:PAS domain S-box protein [Methanolobus sp. ZRKC3]|uniref:PAS domain S-box protein n=1 Tax=Methanolobus sp. ZRKC3 TaxID=3125786 RepID=UPI003254A9C4